MLMVVSIHWTRLLDWNTRLDFDPKNRHLASYSLVGQVLPRVDTLGARVSNQISATTYYNQTPVSQEQKELWSPFLRWLVAPVKCWSYTKSKVFAINHVWARDQNVHLSDLSNYQTFVSNFRQSLPSLIKLMCGVSDLEHMTIYPFCHWPPNFSLQCFCNWMWQGFK